MSTETKSQKGGFLFRKDSDGEFDELFVRDAAGVHIERMNTRSFWIGILLDNGEQVNIRTGVENGKWFFRVEEDEIGEVAHFLIERPACHRKHATPEATTT